MDSLCLMMLHFSFAMFYKEVSRRKPPAAINIHKHMEHVSLDILAAAGAHISLTLSNFGTAHLFALIRLYARLWLRDGCDRGGSPESPSSSIHRCFLHAITVRVHDTTSQIYPLYSIYRECGASISFTLIIFCKPDNSAGAVRARNGFSTLYRIGKELVHEKKEVAVKDFSGDGKLGVSLSQTEGQDILSALGACPFHWGVVLRRIYSTITVRSNMAPDLMPSQIMSDDEVLGHGCISFAHT